MHRIRQPIALIIPVALFITGCSSAPPVGLHGAYRFDDGGLISVRPSADETLRCREYDTGRSRRLYPDGEHRFVSGPGFAEKEPVELVVEFDANERGRATALSWNERGAGPQTAVRVGAVEWLSFTSGETELHARLDLPEGPGPHPAVVLVHGSGKSEGTQWMYASDFFAANGIAALSYDKRGTGESDGEFTMDFQQLARDVVAAVEYLKTRDDIDADRIGVSGYSQGGWVGPLAASMSDDIRYVIVNYGMVESPAEEARLETRQLLRKRGVEEHYMKDVDELTRAAVKVVATRFGDGWDEFGAAKNKYKDAPWRDKLGGSPIDGLMKHPKWMIKLFGKRKLPPGLRWYYDSNEVLDRLTVPTVWLLGEKDESAPNELTIPALNGLQAEGKPIELVVFAGADHGMLIFREENGQRVYTGYAKDYWRTQVQAARRHSGME